MDSTLEDLEPIVAVAQNAGEVEYQKLPPKVQAKVAAAISEAEMKALLADLMSIMQKTFQEGETPELCVDYLKANDKSLGYMQRTLTAAQVASLYKVEGLEPKHVEILKELGLTRTAKVIEDGLAKLPSKPTPSGSAAPAATKGHGSV